MPLVLFQRSCPFAQRHVGGVHALPVDSEGREGDVHRANTAADDEVRGHEDRIREMLSDGVFWQISKSQPIQHCFEPQTQIVEGHLTIDVDLQFPPVFFELPSINGPVGRQPQIDAEMVCQILRLSRSTVGREICRRADDSHPS